MRSCCARLLTAFRVVQLLLSLIVLTFGAIVLKELYSISDSARKVEQTIELLQNATIRQSIEDSLRPGLNISDNSIQGLHDVLERTLVPVLHILELPPIRAIIIVVVSIRSILVVSVVIAISKRKEKPRTEKRSTRLALETFTFFLWIISTVSAITLAVQYGWIAVVGGAPTKIAFKTLLPLLKEAFDRFFAGLDVLRTLSIVDTIVTLGAVSILAAGSACVCTVASLMSLILTCCTHSKQKKNLAKSAGDVERFLPKLPEKSVGYTVVDCSVPSYAPVRNELPVPPKDYPPRYHIVAGGSAF